jgi:hypothetical protein
MRTAHFIITVAAAAGGESEDEENEGDVAELGRHRQS